MKMSSECVGCVLNGVFDILKVHHDATSTQQEAMIRKMLKLASDQDWRESPPEFAEHLYEYVMQSTGATDPFRELKKKSTQIALQMLPFLREVIASQPDPFRAILQTVIGGNIIDFGAYRDFKLDSVEEAMHKVYAMTLDEDAIQKLKTAIAKAKHVFYMLDNCGEAVFDQLLLEQIPGKVTLGVRGLPILNDITRAELEESGLSRYPVVDTGTRTPGVALKRASQPFLDALASADLVLAKGQGNYETLSDYPRPIIFLLRVKCPVVARSAGTPLGALQILPCHL